MALPDGNSDVRLISIDGGKLHLVLASGTVEIDYGNRQRLAEVFRPGQEPGSDGHVFFDGGIYGI